MITKDALISGILNYADCEIMPVLPTAGKWVVGTVLTVATTKADILYKNLLDSILLKSLNIVSSDNMIDDVAIITAMQQSADKYGAIQLDIPMIGSISFKSDDVEKLGRYLSNDTTGHSYR